MPRFILYCLFALLLAKSVAAQQLSLGNAPATLTRSAVLELHADRQGLLLPRVSDTVAINALNPPDGMVVFFTPTRQLLVRNFGYWSALPPEMPGAAHWTTAGNTTGGHRRLGSNDNFDLSLTTNNTERMRIMANGRIGVGLNNPGMPLSVRDSMEIRRVGPVSALLFTNTASNGDFRIGADGGDIFWQGGGARNLQMGSYWGLILSGDRQNSTFPAFSPYTSNPGNFNTWIPAQRASSVPLVLQGHTTQTANLMEWRNGSGTALNVVNAAGNMGLGTTTPDAQLDVNGNIRLGSKGTVISNLVALDLTLGSSVNVAANTHQDISLSIPAAQALSTTRATVAISPNSDLPAGIIIAWARTTSTTQVRVRVHNLTGSAITLASTQRFFITLIDF